MSKTKEIELMCESAQCISTHESKVKVVIDITKEDLSEFINSIPAEDYFKYLSDEVFEKWARDNGYVREAEAK